MDRSRTTSRTTSRAAFAALIVGALGLVATAAACTGKSAPTPKPQAKPAAAKAGPAFDTPADPMAALNAIGDARWVVNVSPKDPARGADAPLVTAVVFSDFECPFCGKLAKTLDAVMPQYEGDVRLVFKHYPLANHARAEPAAKAAEAAHAQGKFWPMHDKLFANQRALGTADLEGYATQLGLDIDKFKADAQRKSTTITVNNSFADGRVLKVTTTPTIFVNGRLIKGAKAEDELRALLDEELAAAKAMVAAGVERGDVYATIMKQATPGTGKRPNRDPTHRRGEASKRTNYAISVAEHNPTRGPADALVTIVEYSAFDCEACAAIQPHLTALLEKYPKDVRLVWRHFPDGRPEAVAAAGAAAAAHKRGKFWELHDKMLANTGKLSGDNLAAWAVEVGLAKGTFVADLGDDALAKQIRIDEAVANKVRGTAPAPFLWVNGRIVDSRDEPTLAEIEALVVEEKAKAEAFMTEKGVARAELYDAMRKTWRGASLIDSAAEL